MDGFESVELSWAVLRITDNSCPGVPEARPTRRPSTTAPLYSKGTTDYGVVTLCLRTLGMMPE